MNKHKDWNRVDVLNIGISPVNMNSAIHTIEQWIEQDKKNYVCITGVHGVMESWHDPSLISIYDHSGLTVPDGMPLVWIGKFQGHKEMERVYGPDLMLEVCKRSVTRGYTHFLYGGVPGVAGLLKQNLEEKFSGINIVGTYTPPFRPLNEQEEKELVEQVAASRPDLFWVGLSTPKQERFMADYLSKLDTKVMIGVGAAFDFHTGRIKDTPDWIKNIGMQWLHRLCQEPRRLWRRYLYNNPLFIYLYLKQLVMGK